MCKCTPMIRTPYCGKGDCVWQPEREIIEKAVYEAKLKTDAFFARHGFVDYMEISDPAKVAFARLVEEERKIGNNIDNPLSRKMFVLGYLKGEKNNVSNN